MKIRNDSVSYIITLHKTMVESFEKYWGDSRDKEVQKVVSFIKEDIIENGTRTYMAGEEMFFKKITFNTDGDTMDKESYETEGKKFDFSAISDEDLWSYIYGEYILKGKLGKIEGFGSTQVKSY